MAKLLSNRLIQELDPNGAPYAGALLFTYEAGTSTKEATYQDEGGSTAHSNPIVLDASGRIPAGVWLTEGQAYKLVLAPSDDTDPPASPIWTLDDVTGINDFSVGGIDQWQASGLTTTYISASQFSVPGDVTSTFHVGRRLKITDAGGTKYATITATAFTSVTTVTVEVDGSTLSSPVSNVSYGVMTAANGSIPVRRDTIPIVADATDPSKRLRLDVANIAPATTVVVATGAGGILPAGIGPLPYSGSSLPAGFLWCDGSAVSRTTYAALFTAIGTTFGEGDTATTFNLPDTRGKVVVGDGTGTITESFTDAKIITGADSATVVSNTAKWTTGMLVTFGVDGTPPTTNPANLLDNNDTVYVVRIDATTIKFATTLANAQNGTVIDITAAGSGTYTITHTLSARTLGQYGGEEYHAQSSTESLLHSHAASFAYSSDTAGGVTDVAFQNTRLTAGNTKNVTVPNFGGNVAMNNMQPFMVAKHIISY